MCFIVWLSLRNANLDRYLPERLQNAIQDFKARLGFSRRIRLPPSSGRDPEEAIANLSIHNGDSSDEEGDHDDELPLAHRWQNGSSHSRQSTTKRRSRGVPSLADRFVSLFTGRGQASAYGLLGGGSRANGRYFQEDEEEDPEGSILNLPTLANHNGVQNHSRQPEHQNRRVTKPKTSPSLFKLDTSDLDAPLLQSNFTLSPSRISQANPFSSLGDLGSPTLGYGFPRSPIRSPSLSRTPSLVAIAEETSPSPRNSAEHSQQSTPTFPNFRPASMARAASFTRSASTDSGTSSSRMGESSVPDWASAVSTQRPRSDT